MLCYRDLRLIFLEERQLLKDDNISQFEEPGDRAGNLFILNPSTSKIKTK